MDTGSWRQGLEEQQLLGLLLEACQQEMGTSFERLPTEERIQGTGDRDWLRKVLVVPNTQAESGIDKPLL